MGTRAWVVLLLGRDEDAPLFLQVKEAGPSVLEPFAGASRFRHHGHRVVVGQKLMQAAGDMLLGWLSFEGVDGQRREFYVRQLWDGKGSAEVDAMGPEALQIYAQLAAGASLAPTPGRATPAPSLPISGRARPSTRRSPSSRWSSRARTRPITARWSRRRSRAGSRRPHASRRGGLGRARCDRHAGRAAARGHEGGADE